jgi:hypothetical protein
MIAALRSVAAVLAGYVIVAACSFAVFRLSGHDPHVPAAAAFMVEAVVSGIAFALAGGYLAGLLAGRRPLAHAVAVAVVLAAGAVASLAATLGHGAVWSQTAAIVLMAPAAALGGWLRARAV